MSGRRTAVGRPSDGQTTVGRPSDGRRTAVGRPSDVRPTAVEWTQNSGRPVGRTFFGRSEIFSADGKKNEINGRRKIFRTNGRSQTTQNVMRIHSVQESSKSELSSLFFLFCPSANTQSTASGRFCGANITETAVLEWTCIRQTQWGHWEILPASSLFQTLTILTQPLPIWRCFHL